MLNKDYASQAKLSYAMIGPQKARRVADLIRGCSLEDAYRQLVLMDKVKPARMVLKLLKSAMANAEQTGVVNMDRLYVKEIMVDDGPRISRFMPRAQGRADSRIKRTSHISIRLAEKRVEKKKKAAANSEEGTEVKVKKKASKKAAKKGTAK